MAAKKTQVTVALLLLITACAPLEVDPAAATQSMPTPLVRVTHAATVSAVPAETQPPPPPLEQIPIPKSDIAQMADDLYGARMIEHISIPALDVESRVIPVGWRIQFAEEIQDSAFEWDSAGADVGWVITSALPDETGNVILYKAIKFIYKQEINAGNMKSATSCFCPSSARTAHS